MKCTCGQEANETGLCDDCSDAIDDIAAANDCYDLEREK